MTGVRYFVIALVLAGCTSDTSKIAPGAIVSNSICADSYLIGLPELEPRIGALSWQSRSALSRVPKRLQSLPQLDNNPERLVALGDVILIGAPGTDEGDIPLSWGEDFATVWKNYAELSKALDVTDPSPALQSRLNALPRPAIPPRVLYLNRAGSSAGAGTFVDAVIRAAGAQNIATAPGWHTPDVEAVLRLAPDALITSFLESDYHGAADGLTRHAALTETLKDWPQIDIPGALWPCAGPGLVEAAEQLNAEMLKL